MFSIRPVLLRQSGQHKGLRFSGKVYSIILFRFGKIVFNVRILFVVKFCLLVLIFLEFLISHWFELFNYNLPPFYFEDFS
ncbi:hypothetical protein CICLE_v10029721mg [Citrus x clementina]|uniref:Uncharacterized protein n=1 Tax=Citrus clementina TaxID=85681 RepID=V4SME7_CITCL|nr:hypothetical protein CICLE_v10029721mg [Citrus x clementina]